VQDTGKLKKGE
jgi:hypothetical protein